jgi:Sulfotransferase domain
MAYSLLPESIKASKCRLVYICREPKDVVVSLWHMIAKFEWVENQFPFNQVLELFCEGRVPNGPVWDHVLEYYMESLQRTHKILFLKYEEMMKDPIDGVTRIASFVGCPFSEEEVKDGVVKEIVDFCSFNKLKDYDANKKGTNDYFFRKAVVGDWKNYLTTEMSNKLDEIIKEKFRNSGFTYGAASITVDQKQ